MANKIPKYNIKVGTQEIFSANSGKDNLLIKDGNGDYIFAPFKAIPYIECTKPNPSSQGSYNQYIDTGYKNTGTTNLVIEVDAQFTVANIGYQLNGVYAGKWADWGIGTDNRFICVTSGVSSSMVADTNRHTFKSVYNGSTSVLYVDGVQKATGGGFGVPSANYFIFARSHGSSVGYGSAMKLYSWKMSYNGTVVRDFVPVVLTQNIPALYDSKGVARTYGTLGLWDKVTEKFYANHGTGKLLTCYDIIDHINFTGTQWIDCQYVPIDINTKCQLDFQTDRINTYTLMGYYNGGNNTQCFRIANNNSASSLYNHPVTGSRNALTWSPALALNTRHKLEFGNCYVKNIATGTNYTSGSAYTVNNTPAIYLARGGASTSYPIASMTCYGAKIYKNTVLMRDLVPVKLNANITADMVNTNVAQSAGTYGMWDLITNKFFANSGTGSFTGA